MIFYNDTKRKVSIHPGTQLHGIECDMSPIKHGEQREFKAPKGVQPWVKMWDHGESGLVILVSAAFGKQEEEEE